MTVAADKLEAEADALERVAEQKRAQARAMRSARPPRVPNPSPRLEYAATHGGAIGPRAERRSSAPDPRVGPIVELGELVAVVYRTTKLGDAGRVDYEHSFGSPRPMLCWNRDGLIVAGGRYKITGRGIEG